MQEWNAQIGCSVAQPRSRNFGSGWGRGMNLPGRSDFITGLRLSMWIRMLWLVVLTLRALLARFPHSSNSKAENPETARRRSLENFAGLELVPLPEIGMVGSRSRFPTSAD